MKVRYIKLGDSGKWEKSSLENDQVVRLGYNSPFHDESLNGEWSVVRDFWLNERNNNEGAATRDINQIRDFYELSEADLWITFYQRKLYWCHAKKQVIELEDGSRIRKVIGAWSSYDKQGSPLLIENIDGRVTKVQGFRGTICSVELQDYLIRKINGEPQPEVEAAKNTLSLLKNNVKDLIKGLWWSDFELLIDLIFSQSGWQRVSVLGKTEKDIDLDVFSPVSQKRAFVQVKSTTNLKQFHEYYEIYKEYKQYDEMYFVYHSINGDNELVIDDPRVSVWDISRIADLVINAGLISWLIEKRT